MTTNESNRGSAVKIILTTSEPNPLLGCNDVELEIKIKCNWCKGLGEYFNGNSPGAVSKCCECKGKGYV